MANTFEKSPKGEVITRTDADGRKTKFIVADLAGIKTRLEAQKARDDAAAAKRLTENTKAITDIEEVIEASEE